MPGRADLDIYQGDDFESTVLVTNEDGSGADLTGFTASAQIKGDIADIPTVPPLLVNIGTSISSPNISLIMPASITAAIPHGTFRWDLQVVDPLGVVTTLLAGYARVQGDVTR